jgi:hypothetical protein
MFSSYSCCSTEEDSDEPSFQTEYATPPAVRYQTTGYIVFYKELYKQHLGNLDRASDRATFGRNVETVWFTHLTTADRAKYDVLASKWCGVQIRVRSASCHV